jgi:hypothetical protein
VSSPSNSGDPPAVKDQQAAHPIPGAWRQPIREIVRAFVSGDYGVSAGVAGVEPVEEATADHIREYIADYGATLIELPEETWSTSVTQWYGKHWEFLIDLWTREEGPSDLVLSGRVRETTDGYVLKVHLVYVP